MKTIGFAICGSYCTFKEVFEEIKKLKKAGYNILPIMSENAFTFDTRFGKSEDWQKLFIEITENDIIHTIPQAEPIGPKKLLDALIIAPCTGNTLAKLASGITDTSVTLAAKAHLRNARPLIIAPSTNDALANAAKNIGSLLNYKNVYFVPFGHDDYQKKPNSMISDFTLIKETLEYALNGEQKRPIVISPK
jgi:dipicolinate synthase subunit B